MGLCIEHGLNSFVFDTYLEDVIIQGYDATTTIGRFVDRVTITNQFKKAGERMTTNDVVCYPCYPLFFFSLRLLICALSFSEIKEGQI